MVFPNVYEIHMKSNHVLDMGVSKLVKHSKSHKKNVNFHVFEALEEDNIIQWVDGCIISQFS
jgi:hypothetical protein